MSTTLNETGVSAGAVTGRVADQDKGASA